MATVYPTKKNALNIKHPVAGQLKIGANLWPDDGFTARMLVQDIVTLDADKAWTDTPAQIAKPFVAPSMTATSN